MLSLFLLRVAALELLSEKSLDKLMLIIQLRPTDEHLHYTLFIVFAIYRSEITMDAIQISHCRYTPFCTLHRLLENNLPKLLLQISSVSLYYSNVSLCLCTSCVTVGSDRKL